ncbi:uncharacterized protein LOC143148279 isoform X1 [Ptiloglossa arizonensis]|uniref:uncharacterized protein LOC143148279 isoform X1 n=1 Tax=Ptiloglossa arizonensis TaxID=3350558 RepID=UPI003FA0D86B
MVTDRGFFYFEFNYFGQSSSSDCPRISSLLRWNTKNQRPLAIEFRNSRCHLNADLQDTCQQTSTKKLQEPIGPPVGQRDVRAMLRPCVEPPSNLSYGLLSEILHHRFS